MALLPGLLPQNHTLPSTNRNQLLLSKVQEEATKRKKNNWLEPTQPKMAEDLTFSRREPLHSHFNTLACWMTYLSVPQQLTIAMITTEKPVQGLKRRAAFGIQTTLLFSDNSWIFPPLCFQFPPFYLDPPIFGVSTGNGVRSWFVSEVPAFPFFGCWIKLELLQFQH